MLVSENILKWALRLYPPLFLQRIWVTGFEKDFRGIKVKIVKSFFNKNYNGSIFGGTLCSAADPFFPVLFHQIFLHKGYNVVAWSKSAEIKFIKPGLTNLYINIHLSEEEITEAEQELTTIGKYIKMHQMDIVDKKGEPCATATVEVYIRDLKFVE